MYLPISEESKIFIHALTSLETTTVNKSARTCVEFGQVELTIMTKLSRFSSSNEVSTKTSEERG